MVGGTVVGGAGVVTGWSAKLVTAHCGVFHGCHQTAMVTVSMFSGATGQLATVRSAATVSLSHPDNPNVTSRLYFTPETA